MFGNRKTLKRIENKLNVLLRYVLVDQSKFLKRLERLENQRVADQEEMSNIGTSYNKMADALINIQWSLISLKNTKRSVKKPKRKE